MPQMIVKYIPHSSHIPGSVKDIRTLRISQEVREWIANHIQSRLNVSGISQLFQKRARDMEKAWQERKPDDIVKIRDHLIIRDDIYNIWKEIVMEENVTGL
ncbi:hypothetical protein C2G38_2050289 [Gigaspora rosea]|uniref:Uncharacterized protein n=1 Tax=Gigaspora rosea TaxID=44941 RepID=A0A397U510_9GLOM|nr:hypothetical protein C2G38_2050289 [Gigaspora rosea]